eukprot:CAMPEP_0182561970 /NCGR_PEP_ID=MMETSP1324-20130603/4384_1 /TAXON_ID=236786 /ORGANISM="Florenciella sp., Strain RCC1587" /LENGTH=66 /DNA_ID=CAMNT_0024774763 /DNA_START=67 /DNA_END=264 /DNA_ORIENTATION=-
MPLTPPTPPTNAPNASKAPNTPNAPDAHNAGRPFPSYPTCTHNLPGRLATPPPHQLHVGRHVNMRH